MFVTNFISQKLKEKFKNKIKMVRFHNRLYVVRANVNIENIEDDEIRQIMWEQMVKKFAKEFRSHILNI